MVTGFLFATWDARRRLSRSVPRHGDDIGSGDLVVPELPFRIRENPEESQTHHGHREDAGQAPNQRVGETRAWPSVRTRRIWRMTPRKVRLMGRGPVSAGRVFQVISGHAACAPVPRSHVRWLGEPPPRRSDRVSPGGESGPPGAPGPSAASSDRCPTPLCAKNGSVRNCL